MPDLEVILTGEVDLLLRICHECAAVYQTSDGRSHYCGTSCALAAKRRYRKQRQARHRDAVLMDGKVVVRGHWAHGEELKRWYAARDAYLAIKDNNPGKFPRIMKKPLSLVLAGTDVEQAAAGGDREPCD